MSLGVTWGDQHAIGKCLNLKSILRASEKSPRLSPEENVATQCAYTVTTFPS